MTTPHIDVTDREGVRWIRIQRPDRKNALSLAMYEAMTAALQGASADGALRAVVLTGSGGVFTAGNDLSDFQSAPPVPGEPHPVMDFLHAVVAFDKPLVLGVDGLAVGLGVTLLPLADLVIATDRARLRAPFVNLALVPEAGSTYLLPLICGHQRAAELLMLGEDLSAERAASWGLVNDVVPPEGLQPRLEAIAGRLAAKPIGALMATKRLLRAPHAAAIRAALDAEGEEFMARLQGPEAMEAMLAFFERRPPDFRQFSS